MMTSQVYEKGIQELTNIRVEVVNAEALFKKITNIKVLFPGENGHHFVIYGDSCSGIPDTLHASNLSAINNVLKNLVSAPEFIIFPGDEISGLTNDERKLRKQWNYWLHTEMVWIKQKKIPLYNTTGNHTTYNKMSERIFRDLFSHLPQNGPLKQKGLSYFVKHDNLLLVFVNTMWSGLGGEGRVETDWLDSVLSQNSNMKYKFVIGHHPVFPVNGFSGDFQREIEPENGKRFWNVLKNHDVLAYFCSHILAFDVQVHDGILQILTAGAGTAHRMPEEIEYLHLMQTAIDSSGLRYQVLDLNGQLREWLKWPMNLPNSKQWKIVTDNNANFNVKNWMNEKFHSIITWNFSGISSNEQYACPQTLISGSGSTKNLPLIWIGLTGNEQRLTVYLNPEVGRSPHHWYGPTVSPDEYFNIQIAIHNGMGPGGLLWRRDDNKPWSSLKSSSPWGAERLKWPEYWSIGKNQDKIVDDMDFQGRNLELKWYLHEINFNDLNKK